MKLTAEQFRNWERKAITLLGMSGVGKTRLACTLRNCGWFHYSADYRIGTRYLDEPILDNVKKQAMQVPFIRELLLSDSIHISNNITVDNLRPISTFLGKVGNPALAGVSLLEFKRRQELHRKAEIESMNDVPEFIHKAEVIYGYKHFINDASGSLCELDAPEVIEKLSEHSLIIYIKATDSDEKELISRAEKDPKPMYYQEKFLDESLSHFMTERELEYVAQIEPDEFVRWVFPRLFYARIPRYEQIAYEHGYTISTKDLENIKDDADFLTVIENVLAQQYPSSDTGT